MLLLLLHTIFSNVLDDKKVPKRVKMLHAFVCTLVQANGILKQYLIKFPNHVGISGNEIANTLNKTSSNFIGPFFSPIPWSDFTPLLRCQFFKFWFIY